MNNTSYTSTWGMPQMQQPQYPSQYANTSNWHAPFNSNVITVTSLEEALIKTTERNSDMIYFHQDKNEFYRIKVDMEGRKSWAAFPYTLPNQEDNLPATKADIQALVARIEALESSKETKVTPKKRKEVVDNGESDG